MRGFQKSIAGRRSGKTLEKITNLETDCKRRQRMKLLTHNFLNCAAKTCKASPNAFPLKFEEVELTTVEMDYNPQFLINVLPRVDWPALVQTAIEVG
jgi:hypothetical protein